MIIHTFFFSEAGEILCESVRDPSPVTAATSPRTPTPKRAPPAPGLYNSNTSAINSPPVVTIAPTPSHSSSISEPRKVRLLLSHSIKVVKVLTILG